MKKLLLTTALLLPSLGFAEDTVDVTITDLVRAETDHMIRLSMETTGINVGEFVHLREPTTPENQTVIRSNQDTLYSSVVLDLSSPVQITLPEIDGRYMSMHVISQDHFMTVHSTPGTYELTEDSVGTRFGFIIVRTFADVTSPDDVAASHAAQDAIEITGGGEGPFEAPNWDTEQLAKARQSVNDLALLGFDVTQAFGTKENTNPVDYLIGALAGWGGLPASSAIYLLGAVEQNDGVAPHSVTVKDVPVRAFWSVTVYNDEGFLEANELGVNSYNDYTATASEDGSVTIHFGGCEDGRVNCLPITPGWNHAIRLYEPDDAILHGDWEFPPIEPVE
ncbi:DUF1254 domain-containing protein [uncultured Shimia sp.]|uniref:DUF1254 domain-containing protein n=1 Tax=uncultured Shimia sp. TaxID=573152 RepID=UPI002637A053|nr:DUF1254 domain-containing protein [uncultured Shimia sp.]